MTANCTKAKTNSTSIKTTICSVSGELKVVRKTITVKYLIPKVFEVQIELHGQNIGITRLMVPGKEMNILEWGCCLEKDCNAKLVEEMYFDLQKFRNTT